MPDHRDDDVATAQRPDRLAVPTLFINGKFTAQSMTGVQRVAHEVVLAMDRRLSMKPNGAGLRAELLCPPGGTLPQLGCMTARHVGPALWSLAAWEQVTLPWAARGGWLVNLAGSAPWWSGSRSVCTLHDAAVFDHPETYTAAFRTWYRYLFRHLACRAGALVTVSEFSRQRLAARLERAPGTIQVVHNGADHLSRVESDPWFLQACGIVPGRYLLVVGTAKSTKNVAAVLQAWRRLEGRDGCALVWVGGVNRRVFAETDASAGMQGAAQGRADGIFRLGVISDGKLKALYENAAGLVVASTYEGFGFPAVEAMFCGCPVAAASAASLPEVCGDAALYFEPGQTDSICQAMHSLLHDEPLRRDLIERGRARMAGFSWDRAAQELLGYLGQMRAARQ